MTAHPNSAPAPSTAALIGLVVTRFVVPLWLLTGAVLKLVSLSPSHLPSILVTTLGGRGVDLAFVARFSVAVELTVALVMLLLPSLARPVGLVMLGCFLPILIADTIGGASSCGCFGAVTVPPIVTLSMDLTLFLVVLLLGRKAPSLRWTPGLPAARTLTVGVLVVACFALAFAWPAPSAPAGNGGPGSNDPATSSAGVPPYYLPHYDQWLGRPWAELDIADFLPPLPDEAAAGPFYVLFYRTTCDHCHELMEVLFSGELTVPTLAVSVPDKGGFVTEGAYPFPCGGCATAELPVGCDWFFSTPVLVRLEAGVVACAAEVEPTNPTCYQW